MKKEDIKVGEKYYTCSYTGVTGVTVIRIFDDTDTVLVKVKSEKRLPFVRPIKYIFDDPITARHAGKDWEHFERKRKKKKK